MVTIKEIAKRAGVAPSTVSRVISNDSRISDATKQRVIKIMNDMSYHPNAIARSLVSKSTKTIGIIMPNSADKAFLNPFFPEALRGIINCVYNEGFCILITNGATKEEQIQSLHGLVRGRRVDGVILMYSSIEDPMLNELKNINIPFSVIGRPANYENVNYVDNDNVQASYDAVEYFISKGHKNIGLINGSMNLVVSIDRYEGYKKALAENNITMDEKLIVNGEFIVECGYEGMKKMLSIKNTPSAVLVTDDLISLGALKAINEFGIRIPQDISLISFNNTYIAQLASPPLTSIDVNAYELGFKSAEVLFKTLNNSLEVNKVLVKTEIKERSSVINR